MRKVRHYPTAGDGQHLHQRRDRLKQLRAFCQAARFGSISRAAEQVMSSQPAVSMQIRTLEEELGVLLFERRGPRIALSRIGQRLYQLAMPLVEGMDRLPDAFAEEHYGEATDDLCIGAGQVSAAYLLPKYLQRFREKYPEIRIEVKTGAGQQRLDWLRNHDLDLVVTAMDITPDDVVFHPVLESSSSPPKIIRWPCATRFLSRRLLRIRLWDTRPGTTSGRSGRCSCGCTESLRTLWSRSMAGA